jgi:hypothetical protein
MSYSDGTGRTRGILNGLGIASAPDTTTLPPNPGGSPRPDSNQPGNQVVNTSPNEQSPQVAPANLQAKALGVIRAVGRGHLPGVYIPTDAPHFKSDITGANISAAGAAFYRPKESKDTAGVLYHPKTVPLSTLRILDAKGKLDEAFPPITKFLGLSNSASGKGKSGVGTPGKQAGQTGASSPAGASTGTPQTGAGGGQSGRNTPSISDLNLTGIPGPTPQAVPVLPKPGLGAAGNAQIANKRVAALAGPPPSQQAQPGAGSIVSNLWRAPV